MHQSKDTEWQIGYKAKTHQCAVSKKPISHARIHKDSKKGMEEDLPSKQRAKKKKKAGDAILISDKIDFKATKIKIQKEGHYIMVK